MRSTAHKTSLDPAATRAAILDAAVSLFAEKGFAATSLNAIAQAADVPKSLVLYHFESKENLWQSVFQSKGKLIFQTAQAIIDGDPDTTLEDLVVAKFRTLQANPDLARLIAWMSLESGDISPHIAAQAHKVRETVKAHPERFPVPTGMQPEQYLVMLMSAVDGFFRFRNLYSRMVGCPLDSPESEGLFLANVLSFARNNQQEKYNGL